MKKRLIPIFFALILMLPMIHTPTHAASQFPDVPDHHWAADEIYYFTEAGVINGYVDGTFKPNESITRGQAAKIIAAIVEVDSVTERYFHYKDVHQSYYAFDAIQMMGNLGIMKGNDGFFRPNDTLTRGEMAVILTRVFDFESSQASPFQDVSNTSYAYESINAIFDNGVTVGFENSTLYKPNNKTSRAEFVVFLANAMQHEQTAEMAEYHAPKIISNPATQTIKQGETISLDLTNYVTDQDRGDSLTFTASNGKVNGSMWSLTANKPGKHNVTIVATDNHGMQSSLTVPIEVERVVKKTPLLKEDTLYNAIYHALIQMESEINVSRFTTDHQVAFDTLKRVLADNPEIFYFSYEGSSFWTNGLFELNYQYPKQDIMQMRASIDEITDYILSSYDWNQMSEQQKVKVIHDTVVLNTAYDYENYLKNTVPETSYNIYGTLVLGKAVCDGYAKTMKYLLEKVGIETLYVTGTANGGLHAWNKVKVDGKWYNLDATWNDPVPNRDGYVRYDYFLISDKELARDHQWDNTGLPKAIE